MAVNKMRAKYNELTKIHTDKENIKTEKKNEMLPIKSNYVQSRGLTNRTNITQATQREGLKINARPPMKKTTSLTEIKKTTGRTEVKKTTGLTEVKKPTDLINIKKTTGLTEIKKTTSLTDIKKPTVPVTGIEIKKSTTIAPKEITKKPINIAAKPVHTTVKEKQKTNTTYIITDKQDNSISYSVHKFGLIEESDTEPELVSVYINDIITHLHNLEKEYIVKETFLENHKTTPSMRSTLINWLVDVHANYPAVQETLYLTISIIDRYLQKNKLIHKKNFQLLGITAYFVASKYEEPYAPEVADLVYTCDNLYTKRQILQMEQNIIKTLGFKFGSPSSLHFLRRYSKIGNVEASHYILSKYLLELTLLEHQYSYILPSLLASSALCLAVRLFQGDKDIISTIVYGSGYKLQDMKHVTKKLATTVLKQQNTKYPAIKKKFSSNSNSNISNRAELKIGLIEKLADKNVS